MKRYLDAIETFTPTDELAVTTKYVEEFLHNQERRDKIMGHLQEKFDKEENWVSVANFSYFFGHKRKIVLLTIR